MIERILEEQTLKWKINQLLEEANYSKLPAILVPHDMLEDLKDTIDSNDYASVAALQSKEATLQNHTNELDVIIKQRIQKLLEAVYPAKFDKSSSLPLLDQYEKALAVNKKGYSVHYKRDIDEIMVNTRHPSERKWRRGTANTGLYFPIHH